MINWRNLPLILRTLVVYSSPLGGSHRPVHIGANQLLIEIISEGSVYGFEAPPQLHGEGAVFCHPEGVKSVSESPADTYYACYVIRFDLAAPTPGLDWPRNFQWKDRKAMHVFMGEMLQAYHHAALDHDVIGRLILARLEFEMERARAVSMPHNMHPQLALATGYLNKNYASAISLEDVAAAAGVSVSHLHMLFREQLGESPHQYLIQRRMRAAGHALATGNQSIKVVAGEVGYPNTETFCRAFRKFFGQSASEYRQAYQH